ncbi:hypothetical protein OHB14_17535 [Streptomyces sp. NBC_01613]|uniref:hypothetical protein n=1 Tax=Streptomyces sp. NBC_01613 TaxID=2975896 RepID=UPI00386F3A4C
MNADLESAIDLAEDLFLGVGRTAEESDRSTFEDYAVLLESGALPPESAERLVHLAKVLLALRFETVSLRVVRLALRQLEIAEAGPYAFGAEVWSDAAALLAEHEQLEQARSALVTGLGKARRGAGSLSPRILANLAAVNLRSGNTEDAGRWAELAEEALDALGDSWASDQAEKEEEAAVRLLVHWVRAAATTPHADAGDEAALASFTQAARQFSEVAGDSHSLSLNAAFDLALRAIRNADATGRPDQAARGREALEIIGLHVSATYGTEDPRALAVRAVLASAEFEATVAGSDPGRSSALAALEHIAGTTSALLGVDHPQSLATLDSRARIPADLPASLELPYHIDHFYLPQDTAARNEAKKEALRKEGSLVRLIAHGGASYLLEGANRFRPVMLEALDRHVHFEIIISNPWNSLGVFINKDLHPDIEVTADNIIEHIRNSKYYGETFVAVTEAYEELRATYGEAIELRLTPMDIPATTLLTSDGGFYEPYVTTDPEYRTSHGMKTFEVRFNRATRLYEDSLAGFATQWELASSLDHFREFEEQYQSRLRLLMTTLANDDK